jgi:hypothetical protein
MVLPDRIELSTSPLPMECSTTELRQHLPGIQNRPKGPYRRAVLATRPPLAQAYEGPPDQPNQGKYRLWPSAADLSRGRPGSAAPSATAISARLHGHNVAMKPRDRLFSGRTIAVIGPMMTDQKENRGRPGVVPPGESRQDRLKQALRENLKRRKSQARGRSEVASSETAEASLDDAGGKKNR